MFFTDFLVEFTLKSSKITKGLVFLLYFVKIRKNAEEIIMSKIKYVCKSATSYSFYLHSHDFWELVYYCYGSGVVIIDSEEKAFQKGDIFLIPPHIAHSETSESGFRNYNFQFEDDSFNFKHYLKFTDNDRGDFFIILKQLCYEYFLNRKPPDQITDLLYEVLKKYIFIATNNNLIKNKYVDALLTDIIKNISNSNYNLGVAMKTIPLAQNYLRDLFVKEIGKTPKQFLCYKRIEYAQNLLLIQNQTYMSIKEIAFRSGFSDPYYFSKVFKSVTNLSPKQWLHNQALT